MLFLVMCEARDTLVGDAVPRLRAEVATAIKRIKGSGKLRNGGVLSGQRRPFFLLEVDSAAEILELLGGEIIDNMRTEVHPVASLDELGEFFAQHPPKA